MVLENEMILFIEVDENCKFMSSDESGYKTRNLNIF